MFKQAFRHATGQALRWCVLRSRGAFCLAALVVLGSGWLLDVAGSWAGSDLRSIPIVYMSAVLHAVSYGFLLFFWLNMMCKNDEEALRRLNGWIDRWTVGT